MPPPPTPQTPAQKRKRLEVSAASLKKPFRSPLVRKPADAAPAPTPARESPGEPTGEPTTESPAPHPATRNPPPTPATPLKTPTRPRPRTHLTPPSPALAAAQKEHTRLTLELHSLQSQLTTTKQALALEKSGEDAILEGQIWKWKHASRSAVEALFAVASEKVYARGGDWRGLFGGRKGWGDEEAELEGVRRERERREREEEREEWGMGVMLRCLGIPEGMVGWDRGNGCWEDIG